MASTTSALATKRGGSSPASSRATSAVRSPRITRAAARDRHRKLGLRPAAECPVDLVGPPPGALELPPHLRSVDPAGEAVANELLELGVHGGGIPEVSGAAAPQPTRAARETKCVLD